MALDPKAHEHEIEDFADLIKPSGPIANESLEVRERLPWPGASPADVERWMTTSGWSLAAASSALANRREPLVISPRAWMKAARLGMALSIYGRRLAETNRARDAASAYKAALVVNASIRMSGTVVGVLAGSTHTSKILDAIDELRPSLDADVLSGFRGFAWPSIDAAFQRIRTGYARDTLDWVDALPSLLRKSIAVSRLERFEVDMDVVAGALTANARPETCAASVENAEARALCARLPSLRTDEAFARFERSL